MKITLVIEKYHCGIIYVSYGNFIEFHCKVAMFFVVAKFHLEAIFFSYNLFLETLGLPRTIMLSKVHLFEPFFIHINPFLIHF